MDVSELVQSKWLTAQDVKDSLSKTVVIIGAGVQKEEQTKTGEKYLALTLPVQLDAKTKEWKVNRTSIRKLIAKMGVETSTWVGQRVVLTTMLMQGGREGIIPV